MMVGPDKKQIFQNERYGQNVLKFLVEYIIKGDVSLQRQHANPLVFALQYVWYRSSCR